MSAQHTPGPWNVATYGDVLRLHVKRGSLSLAEILEWSAGPESRAQVEANARLIAAAPDLLDALKELVDTVDLSKLKVRKTKDFGIMVRHAAATKAIAKAEGRT